MKNKFYEFKNTTATESDLYIYGEIVDTRDGWFGSESDVVLSEFKEELDKLKDIKKLNLYINSPGGSVFTASAMVSMLERYRNSGHKVHAYVDGLCASASTFLLMVANKIHLYKNSIVMIHKPMSMAWGNADELQKVIDTLDKIENSVMLPLYMNKAKVTEDEVKAMVDAETWLDATEMDEKFDVNLLDVEHKAVACASDLFKNYKNTPDNYKNVVKDVEENEQAEQKDVEENVDVKEQETQDLQEQEQDLQKQELIKSKLDLSKKLLNIRKKKEKM